MDIEILPEKKKRGREREEDVEVVEMPKRRVKVNKLKYNAAQMNSYDDKVEVPNIMLMSKEDRIATINNTDNPFGYPVEYWDIYKRERARRHLIGYDNLKEVTNHRIFTNTVDQLPGKTIIKNHRNVNCIKSKENYNNDFINEFDFNNDSYILFQQLGMCYVKSLDSYIEMRCESDRDYDEELKKAAAHYLKNKPKNVNSLDQYIYLTNIHKEHKDFYIDNIWKPEYKMIESKRNCDIYDCFVAIIRNIAGDLHRHICIAGGFALSMYIFKNYGYHVGFKDIDLFIHSCSLEQKDEIIRRFKQHFNTLYNDNVVCFLFGCKARDDDRSLIFTEDVNSSIQIIRRLYSCPQEIITGFDVDCCCILTNMDGQIWVTERGYYSIANGYNVLNFERMSPSYEYRLLKYNNRCAAIWIPFMDYFKNNAIFDVNAFKKESGSTVIMKYLSNAIHMEYIEKKSSDDYFFGTLHQLEYGQILEFKTLNPNEQTINTFHRVFLEDPLTWYPIRPEGTVEYLNINSADKNIVEINDYIETERVNARNITRHFGNEEKSSRTSSISCMNMLNFLYSIDRDIIVVDELPRGVVFGTHPFFTEVFVDVRNRPKINFMYHIYRHILKYSSKMKYLLDVDLPIKGMDTMLNLKFKMFALNTVLNVDIMNPRTYEKYKYTTPNTFCSEDEFNYRQQKNELSSDVIYIIIPNELSELHNELLYRNAYIVYTYKTSSECVRLKLIELRDYLFNVVKNNITDYDREKLYEYGDYIRGYIQHIQGIYFRQKYDRNISSEQANSIMQMKKEQLKNKKEELKEKYMPEKFIIPYEQWRSINTDIPDVISFKHSGDRFKFIDKRELNKCKEKFQFRDGKIYGTNYNILAGKYCLDGIGTVCLEYPVIDNFVAK